MKKILMDEVRQAKKQLESDLLRKLQTFEEETGCKVHDIDFVRNQLLGPTYGLLLSVSTEVWL